MRTNGMMDARDTTLNQRPKAFNAIGCVRGARD